MNMMFYAVTHVSLFMMISLPKDS